VKLCCRKVEDDLRPSCSNGERESSVEDETFESSPSFESSGWIIRVSQEKPHRRSLSWREMRMRRLDDGYLKEGGVKEMEELDSDEVLSGLSCPESEEDVQGLELEWICLDSK